MNAPNDFEPTPEDMVEAQRLIDEGYYQTSSAYRTLNKLPDGMTAIEALERYSASEAAHVRDLWERHARSIYLRVLPSKCVHVTPGVFRAFKRLGGEVA